MRAIMKMLRGVCLASLLAAILLAATADQGGTWADIEASKPPACYSCAAGRPTAAGPASNSTPVNLRSSATITITMTGIVGDPGDIGTKTVEVSP